MKNKKILVAFLILGYLLLVGALTTVIAFFRNPEQFFFNLSAAILLSWIITVIIFYIWAMYYFHIHLAVDDDEDHNESDNNLGTAVALGNKLLKNPHLGETLGLPKGTIRGTIALSLLIAGLALLIASFEMNQTYNANALFVDNFEFIKTAFLMVIAFYFGHKSIVAISDRDQGIYRPGNSESSYNPAAGGGDNFSNNRVEPTSADIDDMESPAIPATGQATTLKNVLKSDGKHVETTDTGTTSDFEDKESVG